MSRKTIRVDVSGEQSEKLRREVLSNPRLSGEQRRKAARNVLPLPSDGSPIDLYCDGEFVGTL